jgi:hypothetical protein
MDFEETFPCRARELITVFCNYHIIIKMKLILKKKDFYNIILILLEHAVEKIKMRKGNKRTVNNLAIPDSCQISISKA